MSPTLKNIGAAPDFSIKDDWPIARLWQIAQVRSEKNRPDLPLLSVYLNRGVIQYSEGGGQVHKPGLDRTVYQVVRKGDFVLNNQQAWRGSVGVSKHEGIISPAYIVFSLADSLDPQYADFLFQSRDLVAQYLTASKGVGDIQRDIHSPWLKNIRIPVPPREEQKEIVRFLDWANGRLERAMRAKRKVIALLNEQKQAIIHRAVTRGLDASVPLKPSTVPWLSDVPAHWTIMPIKHAFISMDYGISDPTFDAGRIRVLGMGQIKDGEIAVPKDGGVNTVDPLLLLKNGDLLFNRTNSSALVGKVGIFRGHNTPVTFASYLVRMRPKSGFDSEYLNFLLNSSSILNIARQFSIPSLHQSNLNPARYGRLTIAIPGLEEQQQILRHLIDKCRPLNEAIRKADLTAQRIAEYRTRLVADVVTGKLDVREASARLPDTTESEIPAVDEGELDPEEADEEVVV